MTQRFLFAVVEGGGNSPPVLGLAQRLAARGHEVRLLGDPALAEDARRQGLTLVPFRHAPHHNFRSRERDRVRDWAAKSPLRAIQRVTAEVMFEPAHAYARDVLEQERARGGLSSRYVSGGGAARACRCSCPAR